MGAKERKVENHYRLRWTEEGKGRLFRNTSALAWVGKVLKYIRCYRCNAWLNFRGITILDGGVRVKTGLVDGGADLIGWTWREIGPEDVGKHLAVFTAVECKQGKGVASAEQRKFLKQVEESGGVAILGRVDEEKST